MNYKVIAHTLGWVLNIEAVCLMLPLICAIIYGDKTIPTLLICIALCLAIGIPLAIKPPKNKAIYAKEGFL